MEIQSIRILSGANIYSHNPVVLMRLDLESFKGKNSREIPKFNAKLLELFPALNAHYCDFGEMCGFVQHLHDGTNLSHVIEHVVIELLAQSGFNLRHKRACRAGEKNDSKAVVETNFVETTKFLMPVAAETVEAIITGKEYFFEEKILQAKEITADAELGPSAQTIVSAAERRGISWRRENSYNSLIQLGYGKNLRLVQAATTDRTGLIGVDLAGDKDAAKERLRRFSIPVPDGEIVRTESEALEALETLGAPVVVKPLDGRQGKGVSLHLKTPEEVVEAFQIARKFSSKVLVEELFEGKNYRVLVVDGKMVAASERVPCGVIGDGIHTISELIEIENRNPLRGEGHEKPLTKIKVDSIVIAAMLKDGKKMEDVPASGERINLCAGMNLSTGGTARDVTDEVHPSIKSLCERAARIIGLDICGVDLVVEEISAPISGKGGILELNAAPGLRMHAFPTEGTPRDVGGAIIDMLYPAGNTARIPIISITGTNGKTTVTRMIAHILSADNLTVGMTTSSGIYLNGELIVKGDTTGPISAHTLLGDKGVDIAVLETARGGLVRRGMAYDWSDIGVITNISEDHIGQDDIKSIDDLIGIKSLVAERVRAGGTLVLNADDENSQRVLERENVKAVDKKIVFFSFDENNPRILNHLKTGGTAYVLKNNSIKEISETGETAIISPQEIPATLHATADFQTANSMAAIAACRAFGISPEKIARRLQTFRTDTDNPGRNNLYKVGGGYAVVDYGHNPDGFEAICRMVAKWNKPKVTGIVSIAGDRDDETVRKAGRIAARGFKHIIATEDVDRRGRAEGEIPRLLYEAISEENPDCFCEIMPNETEAVSKALREMTDDEIVVIFYDQLSAVQNVLAEYGAVPVSSLQ